MAEESAVALVTGAGSGMGQLAAQRLAHDGARVAALERGIAALAVRGGSLVRIRWLSGTLRLWRRHRRRRRARLSPMFIAHGARGDTARWPSTARARRWVRWSPATR